MMIPKKTVIKLTCKPATLKYTNSINYTKNTKKSEKIEKVNLSRPTKELWVHKCTNSIIKLVNQ
jgi:hypothetical protein